MMLRTHVWFNYNDTFDYPWGIVVIICIRPDVVCDEVIGVYAFLTVTLQHLTRLILSNNRITYLPPDIVQLSSLEYLSLFNNHLEVSDTVTLLYRRLPLRSHRRWNQGALAPKKFISAHCNLVFHNRNMSC